MRRVLLPFTLRVDESALHQNLETTWLVHPSHIDRKRTKRRSVSWCGFFRRRQAVQANVLPWPPPCGRHEHEGIRAGTALHLRIVPRQSAIALPAGRSPARLHGTVPGPPQTVSAPRQSAGRGNTTWQAPNAFATCQLDPVAVTSRAGKWPRRISPRRKGPSRVPQRREPNSGPFASFFRERFVPVSSCPVSSSKHLAGKVRRDSPAPTARPRPHTSPPLPLCSLLAQEFPGRALSLPLAPGPLCRERRRDRSPGKSVGGRHPPVFARLRGPTRPFAPQSIRAQRRPR